MMIRQCVSGPAERARFKKSLTNEERNQIEQRIQQIHERDSANRDELPVANYGFHGDDGLFITSALAYC